MIIQVSKGYANLTLSKSTSCYRQYILDDPDKGHPEEIHMHQAYGSGFTDSCLCVNSTKSVMKTDKPFINETKKQLGYFIDRNETTVNKVDCGLQTMWAIHFPVKSITGPCKQRHTGRYNATTVNLHQLC